MGNNRYVQKITVRFNEVNWMIYRFLGTDVNFRKMSVHTTTIKMLERTSRIPSLFS